MSIKISNVKITKECMERINVLQEHIMAVENAARYISSATYRERVINSNLRELLIEEELEEWRNLCMWGLTVDDKTRDRIKVAARQRFLRDDISVAHWLNNGVMPGHWLVADEDEFKEMAKKAFGGENV